ncbi:MAG: hypothetical protein CMK32_14210 [Porticoccaceae bacterium]|nr:hypothetical protein [Porticoccaceae bacterium]
MKLQQILLLTATFFLALTAHAYNFRATDMEYMSSTEICKAALTGKTDNLELRQRYLLKRDHPWKALIWKVGGWHYCGGAIKVRRAKNMVKPHERESTLKDAISNTKYSYNRIDKSNPWAIDMAITMADAYKELGEWQKSIDVLDQISQYHTNNSKILTMYGMVYYDRKDFPKAMTRFEQASKAAGGSSAEIIYFMGLTAFKLGDIESAKRYAVKAKAMGYPLAGLWNMVNEHP